MLASMRGDSRWYLEKAQSKLRGGLAGAVPQHHSLDRSYSCPIRRNNTTFSFAVVSEPLMSNCGCKPAVLCSQPNQLPHRRPLPNAAGANPQFFALSITNCHSDALSPKLRVQTRSSLLSA